MDIPSYINSEAWQGFVEMRRDILKKPLTERAIKIAINKLEKLLKQGQDPTAVLDQSTFHNWQGLYAVKEDDNGQIPGQATTSGWGAGRRHRDFTAERDESRQRRYASCNGTGGNGHHPAPRNHDSQEPVRRGNGDMEAKAHDLSVLEALKDFGVHRRD